MPAQYEATKSYRGEYNRLFSACQQALLKSDFAIQYADPVLGAIEAIAESSIRSSGEFIHVKVSKEGVVSARSQSAEDTGASDYGKNKSNVDRLFVKLDQLLTDDMSQSSQGKAKGKAKKRRQPCEGYKPSQG